MKTIYEDELYEVTHTSALDKNHYCMISLQPISTGRETETVALGYYEGEYADCPLLFIAIPLTDAQTLALIRRFDTWYGNTDQDVELWALEFQLSVRMLLDGYLVIDPKYLELDEVIDSVFEIITGGTANGTV